MTVTPAQRCVLVVISNTDEILTTTLDDRLLSRAQKGQTCRYNTELSCLTHPLGCKKDLAERARRGW